MSDRDADARVLVGFALGEEAVAGLAAAFPRVAFIYTPCSSRAAIAAHIGAADVLFAYHPPQTASSAPNLRWMQLIGAGYDHLVHGGAPPGVVVTNAPLFAVPIAEYVLTFMLAYSRRLPEFAADLRAHRRWPTDHWATHTGRELAGQTLGIVGYGEIGRAVARLGLAFGMEVMAVRRSAAEATAVEGVRVLPSVGLADLLWASDFVVLCVPLTPQTHHLMGEAEFRRMKHGAMLINVARGAVVDEEALLAALQQGRVGGATLDVFAHEPLPPDSPFYDVPNVWLTPHISGVSTAYHARIAALFSDNLDRYLAGRPLRHVVRAFPEG